MDQSQTTAVAIAFTLMIGVVACDNNTMPTGAEGVEGSEVGGGMEAGESGIQYGVADIFDEIQSGARAMVRYDAPSMTFVGTIENTTSGILRRVRFEVHLSNGVELGPTTRMDLNPGQVINFTLSAAGESFVWFTGHPEVG